MISNTIKIRGKDCFHVSKRAMKALYDANLHHGVYVMYNNECYVKPEKLTHKAKMILKSHSISLN